jgi:hypothetical protein
VSQLPPTSRAPGASEWIEVGPSPRRVLSETGNRAGEPGDTDTPRAKAPPEPPVYDETLDQVKGRIVKAFPKRFRFVHSLDQPHPMIGRLLQQYKARREKQAKIRVLVGRPPLC